MPDVAPDIAPAPAPFSSAHASENDRLQAIFTAQKAISRAEYAPSIEQRLGSLETLATLLRDNQAAICEAINNDFGTRSARETKMLEISALLSGVAYTQKRLRRWAKPQRRHVSLTYFGAKNRVIPQPKGVIGVITPWNYPLFLALSPTISALAAGNRCIIKMAANSQNLCRLLDHLVSQVFDENVLAVIPGASASVFSSLPWDHLVFTGSAQTGKQVMQAAAHNLTPVTLELGGKSPTLVADDFDLEEAAKRILFTKFLNAGQTCVAPDYLLLPKARVDTFVKMAQTIVSARISSVDAKDYTAVIDEAAFTRLTDTLADATAKGGEVVNLLGGNDTNSEAQKIAPHLVINTHDGMRILQEEVFGPLLPIVTYESIDQVIDYINARERPLALYLFSHDKALQAKVLARTLSGGVCINDSMFHVGQHDMPFGGIGNSGMGHYHGQEGFNEFSKLRPVFTQARHSVLQWLMPPYGKVFDRAIALAMKFRL